MTKNTILKNMITKNIITKENKKNKKNTKNKQKLQSQKLTFKEKIRSGFERFFIPPNVEEIETQLAELKEEKTEPSGKIFLSTKSITMFWLMGIIFALIGYYLFNFLNTLFIII